jgi:glycogen synthase
VSVLVCGSLQTLLCVLLCWPVQVGGLGDVVTSLAKAHQATGTLVEIVMPKYDCANYGPIEQLRHLNDFDVAWNGQLIRTKAWCGVVEGLPVYMLEPQQPSAFFWRGRFYGEVRVKRFQRNRQSMGEGAAVGLCVQSVTRRAAAGLRAGSDCS